MADYTITRLGHQGDGIAAGPIFAPLTLPGEVVTGTLSGQKLTDIRVVTPSSDRVSAPCRHFKACGGCQLQHASNDFVADWKVGVVRSALTAQGIETAFRPILTSAPGTRRRASFSARRTKKGAMAGFHARASDTIVAIPDCQLIEPALLAAVPVAEELAQIGGSRKGELSVLATMSEAGLDIAVTGGKPLDGQLRIDLAAQTEKHGLARLAWGDEVVAMRHPPVQNLGGVQVVPPFGAFLQATKDGEEALRSAVQEIVAGCDPVVDLFAGCGTFALPMARAAEIHAVEGAPDMMAALDRAWREGTGLKRITHEARDLFRRPLLPDELAKFGAAVIDPPRAGAEAQVQELAQSGIPVIAFVSCNPVTFARDARILLAAGYRLNWVQVVDQFRWSSHVELVGSFSLTSA
ncbi:class I SAM-dependent RNA methyltransferase [Thalassobius sp. S69A]|uniref:class I SAM-dependent RNA methyltransferase n=1 Tax=unclassified Thalassovita TaxID=2619711 RepID=UPI000C0C7688|nr:RNA methyltransferase [Paracoccaceae bacterium]MBT27035.1 RNA methyltransferase [Paracoccaceae bacterium]